MLLKKIIKKIVLKFRWGGYAVFRIMRLLI